MKISFKDITYESPIVESDYAVKGNGDVIYLGNVPRYFIRQVSHIKATLNKD